MRPPPPILEDIALTAGGVDELLRAVEERCSQVEKEEIKRLSEMGLPPVVSVSTLAAMTGYNSGFLWSLIHQTRKHYRKFTIPKGNSRRCIEAPKVGLKFVQKWLSLHFERVWESHNAVHGFVTGRSHISAAAVHLGSQWVVSVDIEDFFSIDTRTRGTMCSREFRLQIPEKFGDINSNLLP